MSWIDAARTRARLLFSRRAAEARSDEEIRFHIEMETERLVRDEGLIPDEARRRALAAFGGVTNHREELREGRGLAWLGGLSLDLKLGVRMLAKYPGLSLIGVLGMAIAVAIGAASFGILYTVSAPALPLDEGDRIVAIQNVTARRYDAPETHLHDLPVWRDALSSVEILGAYRTVDRNLITRDGPPESVRLAEMTASGFRVARVPPLLGRYFNEDDERPGAPPVVVIGHRVWLNRFAGASDVLGRALQLGDTPHTVVGVMPEGFGFPIDNDVWTPLRLDPTRFERGEAPAIQVFGRLAPDATVADAQAQLATVGTRLAAAHPQTHEDLRARVLPYTRSFLDVPELAWVFHLAQLMITLILVVIGVNVAILVYARTATRMGEIAMRTALGASRGRIVAQLFAEALVLSVAAAALGLAAASLALRWIDTFLAQMPGAEIPFWMDFDVSLGVVLYVAGLAVLGALVVGVVPALKATRRGVHANLQSLGPAGSAMRLGRLWTVLIVTQVATTVAFLPIALEGVGRWVRESMAPPSYATREFLTASLRLDREVVAAADRERADADFSARNAYLQGELVRRLEAEPGIVDVVLSSDRPGGEAMLRLEVEGATDAAAGDTVRSSTLVGRRIGVGEVEADFFRAYAVPILAGRSFQSGDLAPAAAGSASRVAGGARSAPAIVNESFVRSVLGGANPLGRRVRTVPEDGERSADAADQRPWREIVGVVPDFPEPADIARPRPRVYLPMLPGEASRVTLSVRVRGTPPANLGRRLRELTVGIDPMLRLGEVIPLAEGSDLEGALDRGILVAFVLVTGSVLMLSAAGIYALTSFTITRRRREIGIRAALGASPRRILASVLRRAAAQIAIGVAIGTTLAGLMFHASESGLGDPRRLLLLVVVPAFMAAVGLAAALGPTRRALRIQPTEALRGE